MRISLSLSLALGSIVCSSVLTGTCAVATEPSGTRPTDSDTISALAQRGRYLATLADCAACHTAKGGVAFAGGRSIETGFGEIDAPNLTPDRTTGIGDWSNEDFYRALHTGHDRAGRRLYPAFPYPWFTRIKRVDVDAIKAYLDSLPAIHKVDSPPHLDWWLNWRPLLAGWNLLYFESGEFRPDPRQSPAWNQGAYIVEGLGHCGDCHTPKRLLGGAIKSQALSGGYTRGGLDQGWFAPSLRGEERAGLGRWSAAEIVEYLRAGSNLRAVSAGPMTEVIADSTSHFTDADLAAVATYLKSLPSQQQEAPVTSLDRKILERGEGIYTDQCAGCHMHDGAGIAHTFPPLQASSAIQAGQPATIIRVVLEGARVPASDGQRSYLAMPAFGPKLNNEEVADVVSYIRNAWGNRASTVDAERVAKSRAALAVPRS